jgi:hypothetical protein
MQLAVTAMARSMRSIVTKTTVMNNSQKPSASASLELGLMDWIHSAHKAENTG